MCIAGFGIKEKPAGELINYLITAMTVLVVVGPVEKAVPMPTTLKMGALILDFVGFCYVR